MRVKPWLAWLALLLSPAGWAAPQRIASLNICIDQLLWQLVPHERLVSLSYLTADPLWSPIASQLGAMHLNHGLAEELVPLKPDVIIAGEFDALAATELLQRLGYPVVRLAMPRDLAGIGQQVRELGQLVGEERAAADFAQGIDRQLQQLRDLPKGRAPRVFWYSSNGVAIGAGTLEHELMQLAGLHNLADDLGMQGYVPLDLELLLAARPELLIIEESNAAAFSLAREYLSHPALGSAGFRVVSLPAGLSGCAAPVVGDVVQALEQELNTHPLSGSHRGD